MHECKLKLNILLNYIEYSKELHLHNMLSFVYLHSSQTCMNTTQYGVVKSFLFYLAFSTGYLLPIYRCVS